MKLSKLAILLIGLPSFLFSVNGRSWLGIESDLILRETRNAFCQRTAESDADSETDEVFEESIEDASSFIDNQFDLKLLNQDKEYINFLVEGEGAFSDYKNSFEASRNIYTENFQETEKEIEEYVSLDSCFSNLYRLYDNNFSVEPGDLEYNQDFVCDQGRVDFLSDLNTEYEYDILGLGEPEEILNPEYLEKYSVYDNVVEDHENGNAPIEETNIDKNVLAIQKKIGRSAASVATLTSTLVCQGLSYGAVETIKGSFLSIRAAIRYWLPWAAKVAIITGAIIALTIVFVTYWKQIKRIADAIVDRFASIAQGFAEQITKAFDSILSKAKESDYDKKISIDGTDYFVKIVDGALAKTFSEYGNKVYHRAFIVDDLVLIDINQMKKAQASFILQLQNEPYRHNIYTYKQNDAWRVRNDAFPGARIFPDINNSENYAGRYVLKHYHADYSSTSGKDHDIKNHSFFGQPVFK